MKKPCPHDPYEMAACPCPYQTWWRRSLWAAGAGMDRACAIHHKAGGRVAELRQRLQAAKQAAKEGRKVVTAWKQTCKDLSAVGKAAPTNHIGRPNIFVGGDFGEDGDELAKRAWIRIGLSAGP